MPQFIKENECREITGLSLSTRRRKEKAGRFSRRYHLSRNVTAYKESEIQEWLEQRRQEVSHV